MRQGQAATAWGLALLGPAFAWLVWISWSEGGAGDGQSVAWFVTVAAGCVLAGRLAPSGWVSFAGLSVAAFISTMVTLYAWWSSEDTSGLFLVGLMLAGPLVLLSVPVLMAVGRTWARAREEHRGPRRRRTARP